MDVQKKLELASRNALEVVTPEELKTLFETKEKPTAYIGYEPSGFVHAGQAITASKIIDLQEAGVEVTIFLADWHALINDKLGGKLESIRVCGEYLKECFLAVGVKDNVKFVWASDLCDSSRYWERFIRIAKSSSMSRIRRAMTIMGRAEDEAEMDSSKMMYPPMQAADIFELGVDIALAGMDQRRAHMLARDAADKLAWKKPIAIHTPLLVSLLGGGRMDPVEAKMSKSSPNSAIFLHDSPEDITRKMKNAFCPTEAEGNPVIDVLRLIVFPKLGSLHIDRPAKYGGPIDYASFNEVLLAYTSGKLHAQDLKKGAADGMTRVLEPIREYFKNHPENLEKVKKLSVTR
ncbi:MAG: tyrosine--tRNA ligase [Euryarchaeota archaeon RBG_19FT_COMBO_56_21]|nr:MAG: tyrosine--tRNA ligase [Euryarchaeota archaeon RBG_19FT_COMBO_56_21]